MANYQNDKPAAADQLNQSQADIQQNFLAIDDLINVDHEDFAGGAGLEGKHKQVTLTEQAGDPGPSPNEICVYSKLSAVTADTGLFWQKENSGDVIEISEFNVVGNNGYTMLPSGLKINFGQGTINAGQLAGAAILFTSAFTTTCFACSIQSLTGNTGNDADDFVMYPLNLANTGFTPSRVWATHVGAAVTFSYIAIGD
jgi:hypothetical protein